MRLCASVTCFPNATVVLHDLQSDPPIPADVQLFHRVDTELGDRDWRDVFQRFRGERILFIPGELVTFRGGPNQAAHRSKLDHATPR